MYSQRRKNISAILIGLLPLFFFYVIITDVKGKMEIPHLQEEVESKSEVIAGLEQELNLAQGEENDWNNQAIGRLKGRLSELRSDVATAEMQIERKSSYVLIIIMLIGTGAVIYLLVYNVRNGKIKF